MLLLLSRGNLGTLGLCEAAHVEAGTAATVALCRHAVDLQLSHDWHPYDVGVSVLRHFCSLRSLLTGTV